MELELLTVGTELVLGAVVDTNAADAGRVLAEAGFTLTHHATVPDEAPRMRRAIEDALTRTGMLIVTGGLGPTRDDFTKSVVAEVLKRRLVRDAKVLEGLEALYRARGMAMPAANATQADVIEGATVLANPRGTAPGLWIEDGARVIVLLPGVPKEMRGLLAEEVIPRLQRRGDAAGQRDGGTVIRSRTIRTAGISESALADRLGDYQGTLGANVTLAFLPSLAGTDLRLTAWRMSPTDADAALMKAADAIRPKVGDHVYGEDGTDLAAVVLAALERDGVKLAVAESCTGGLVGARLTAVPGSSRVFVGGVVAYDNEVKLGFLGVSADTLAKHGAVSEEVAREMASGVARALGTEAALAITGIAGPDGGTPEKPVGLVWVALRWRERERVLRFVFPGDREDIRARATQWALDNLRRLAAGR